MYNRSLYLLFLGSLEFWVGTAKAQEVVPWTLVRPQPAAQETIGTFSRKVFLANTNDLIARLRKNVPEARAAGPAVDMIRNPAVQESIKTEFAKITFKVEPKIAKLTTALETTMGDFKTYIWGGTGTYTLGYYIKGYRAEFDPKTEMKTVGYGTSW